MNNCNRTYLASLMVLGLLTATSSRILFFLTGASEGGALESNLPPWALPWAAVINLIYTIAIVVTICARQFKPETGRALTRVLNWALLPALPGGTFVGLYGLLRADRE